MGNLSEINLGNQILSIVVAGGMVAFGALILRILLSGIKFIFKKFKAKNKSVDIKNKN